MFGRVLSLAVLIAAAAFHSSCAVPFVSSAPILNPTDENLDIKHLYSVRDEQFSRTIGSLLGPPIQGGNEIATLLNGDEIFPSMLEAIRGAKDNISLESYIYWSGDVGNRFADAIAERARSGVKVHILLDWFGIDRLDQSFVTKMKDAGAEVYLFRRPRWFDPRRWRNFANVDNRTHRKLLVVDGKIGFTGGVGIADNWSGHAESPEHWRDTHFRIVGPVVAQMQSAFEDNWLEAGGEVLHSERYFPPIAKAGEVRAQVFKSSAGEATANIELMYHLAIAAAEKNIFIESAYFVPDEGTIKILVAAAKRGVQVEIILPGPEIDNGLVRVSSRGIWGDLLQAGIRIYEYQPTMFHCKVLVVDNFFVSVGSTNFDNRSFRLNDEANLNIFDEKIALEQERIFAADKAHSKEITLQSWEHRPAYEKVGNFLTMLVRHEL